MGNLNLLKKVDAHLAVVTLFGEEDLDEVGCHGQAQSGETGLDLVHRRQLEGLLGPLATCSVVGIEDVLGDLGNGKVLEGTAHVATNVSQLQTPGQHGIDRCAGNYTQGPLLRGGPR